MSSRPGSTPRRSACLAFAAALAIVAAFGVPARAAQVAGTGIGSVVTTSSSGTGGVTAVAASRSASAARRRARAASAAASGSTR